MLRYPTFFFRIFILTILILTSIGYTQINIKGTVVDTNGSPVPGASVELSCSDVTTVTDISGEFSLIDNPSFTIKRKNNQIFRLNNYPLSLDLFSLSGKKIRSINLKSPDNLRKKLNGFLSQYSRQFNSEIKILRIKTPHNSLFIKISPLFSNIGNILWEEKHLYSLSKRSAETCILTLKAERLLPEVMELTNTDTILDQIVMEKTRLVDIDLAWAKNSVNGTIFRWNSITTYNETQYVSYYDSLGNVMLAKRNLGSTEWELRKTQYTGDINDAHTSICIAVDCAGYLHLCWDHHGDPLRYVRSTSPGSLDLTGKMSMTGQNESNVTYPEFYNLPDGNLVFLYRDGSSGNGNVMMNHYDVSSQNWSVITHNFIDGEGERNAYWQFTVDQNGYYHISWNWRETGGVETNHDLCYAVSKNGGQTWQKSTGETYQLPITAGNAEYAITIPQNSELINTTSITVDSDGHAIICSYWRLDGTDVPQYHIVYHNGSSWQRTQVTNRYTPFTLSGTGTKKIPISRPKILAGENDRVYMLFRDVERDSRVSLAYSENRSTWEISDLSSISVGEWEPSYDPVLWKREKLLHIFMQNMGQGEGEQTEDLPAQMVHVLEWTP